MDQTLDLVMAQISQEWIPLLAVPISLTWKVILEVMFNLLLCLASTVTRVDQMSNPLMDQVTDHHLLQDQDFLLKSQVTPDMLPTSRQQLHQILEAPSVELEMGLS